MTRTPKPGDTESHHSDGDRQLDLAITAVPSLEDPRTVLSLLEADQVVAAKRQTRFGARKFSFGLRVLLWGLRVYVSLMLVIVLLSVWRALQAAH